MVHVATRGGRSQGLRVYWQREDLPRWGLMTHSDWGPRAQGHWLWHALTAPYRAPGTTPALHPGLSSAVTSDFLPGQCPACMGKGCT